MVLEDKVNKYDMGDDMTLWQEDGNGGFFLVKQRPRSMSSTYCFITMHCLLFFCLCLFLSVAQQVLLKRRHDKRMGGMMVSFSKAAPPLHARHSSPHLSNLRFHKRRDRKCEEIIVNTLFENYSKNYQKMIAWKKSYFNNLSLTSSIFAGDFSTCQKQKSIFNQNTTDWNAPSSHNSVNPSKQNHISKLSSHCSSVRGSYLFLFLFLFLYLHKFYAVPLIKFIVIYWVLYFALTIYCIIFQISPITPFLALCWSVLFELFSYT